MKKIIILILLVLIVLIIAATIIDQVTFDILRKFEIDNEEKVQIVDVSHMMDASWVTYYNFDFNKKNVISLHSSTSYGPGNEGRHLSKEKYKLTDEEIVTIKEKIEKLETLSDENKSSSWGYYEIITKDGKKMFSDNNEAVDIIEDIISVTYDEETKELLGL